MIIKVGDKIKVRGDDYDFTASLDGKILTVLEVFDDGVVGCEEKPGSIWFISECNILEVFNEDAVSTVRMNEIDIKLAVQVLQEECKKNSCDTCPYFRVGDLGQSGCRINYPLDMEVEDDD